MVDGSAVGVAADGTPVEAYEGRVDVVVVGRDVEVNVVGILVEGVADGTIVGAEDGWYVGGEAEGIVVGIGVVLFVDRNEGPSVGVVVGILDAE